MERGFSGAIGTRFLELSRIHVPTFGRSCVFPWNRLVGFVFFWGLENKHQLKLRLLFLQEKQ